jgi:hypothetical protein
VLPSGKEVPARKDARAGCLADRTTMTENATQWFEPDASNADQPTTDTGDAPARIYDDEGVRVAMPTCACCGAEL